MNIESADKPSPPPVTSDPPSPKSSADGTSIPAAIRLLNQEKSVDNSCGQHPPYNVSRIGDDQLPAALRMLNQERSVNNPTGEAADNSHPTQGQRLPESATQIIGDETPLAAAHNDTRRPTHAPSSEMKNDQTDSSTGLAQDTGQTPRPSQATSELNGEAQKAGWSGAGYIEKPSDHAAAAYERIRETSDDVEKIAASTGINSDVLARVKTHLFMTEHDVPLGANEVKHGYFTPDDHLASLWTKATEGSLLPEEAIEFRSLVSHEYVESKLMEAGLPYRSAHPSAWDKDGVPRATHTHFGAHDIAPTASTGSLKHWTIFGLEQPKTPIADDLSNLDDVVVKAALQGINR